MKFASDTYGTTGRSLFPEEHTVAINALLDSFHDVLGPNARRVAYHYLLSLDRSVVTSMFGANVDWVQAAGMKVLYPFAKDMLVKAMGANKPRSDKSLVAVQQQFDMVAQRLADNGTGYLIGNSFTAADLSFSALAAPILLVQVRGRVLSPVLARDERVATSMSWCVNRAVR